MAQAEAVDGAAAGAEAVDGVPDDASEDPEDEELDVEGAAGRLLEPESVL